MASDNQQSNVAVIEDPQLRERAEQAARKKRYAELRERLGKSKLEVIGLPGIHYFWALNDSSEMARLDIQGYRIVREPNAEAVLAGKATPKVKASGLRQDGTYVVGDVILTEVEEEVYEFIQLDIAERHEQLVEGGKADFIMEAEKKGIPTFETTGRKK